MNPVFPALAFGLHIFLACLVLPGNPGFAVNAGFAAFWMLMFFRALFRSLQETASE